jgi:hypothetical protein
VIQLNALSAEDRFMVGAVEMFDPFTVFTTELADH